MTDVPQFFYCLLEAKKGAVASHYYELGMLDIMSVEEIRFSV